MGNIRHPKIFSREHIGQGRTNSAPNKKQYKKEGLYPATHKRQPYIISRRFLYCTKNKPQELIFYFLFLFIKVSGP